MFLGCSFSNRSEIASCQVVARPAPKFKSDREMLEEIRRTQPEISEAATKKDEQLHKRLQDVRQRKRVTENPRNSHQFHFQVFVTSTDPDAFNPDALKQVENPERPLPRKSFRDGSHDPVKQHPLRYIRIGLHALKYVYNVPRNPDAGSTVGLGGIQGDRVSRSPYIEVGVQFYNISTKETKLVEV